MASKKITDLAKKSVSSEKAQDIKGGRKLQKFNKGGSAKKKSALKTY